MDCTSVFSSSHYLLALPTRQEEMLFEVPALPERTITLSKSLNSKRVLDEISWCDKFTGSLLGKLNLAIGASSAEIEATTEKGTIKATEYGKGYRFDKNGWIYVHIEGEPYERGFQHGYLVASELDEILESLKYLTYWNTGKDWEFFVEK